jgi:hypothetical protein
MADLAEDLVAEAPAPARRPEDGYVDFFGHAPGAGGWLFCGWSRARWHPEAAPPRVVAHFRHGQVVAEAVLACWFPRPDLGRRGAGLIVLVPAGPQPLGDLVGLELVGATPVETLRLSPVRPLVQLREADLLARILSPLREAPPGAARARLIALAGRRGYAGRDTLHELPAPVQIGVDEVVAAPPDGLALIGWCLDPEEAVAAIRVRGPGGTATLEERLLRLPRPDVIESLGARHGLTDANVGFLAFAPGCAGAGYLEVELKTGEVGYQRLPAPGRSGLAAARRLLEAVRLGPDEMDHAFDRVLGPALGAIHRARLARPRPAQVVAYGTPPEAPECSVVVPLYGRMDFLAYQLALFSEHPANAALDLIYVLDDPPRKRELMDLAHSAHRRFGLPFRLVLPAENLGYGPANQPRHRPRPRRVPVPPELRRDAGAGRARLAGNDDRRPARRPVARHHGRAAAVRGRDGAARGPFLRAAAAAGQLALPGASAQGPAPARRARHRTGAGGGGDRRLPRPAPRARRGAGRLRRELRHRRLRGQRPVPARARGGSRLRGGPARAAFTTWSGSRR